MKTLGHSAAFIGTVALILCIVGVAIPYWEHWKALGVEDNFGLWEICWRWDGITNKICLTNGILMITGTVMYATKTIIGIKYLHAGFGLCVTSGCLSIISGALYFFAEKREFSKLPQKSDLYHVAHM